MKGRFIFFSILIGTIISFVGSEIIVRLFARKLPDTQWEKSMFCRNTRMNYRFMKPGVSGYQTSIAFPTGIRIKANVHGYRDTEWSEKKNSGKKPILLLGDSFGWGWGCHQDSTIARFFEAELPTHVVYNLCIPGDNLFKQHLRYRYHVDQTGADHVIILNYINDFFDISDQQRKMNETSVQQLYSQDNETLIECDSKSDQRLLEVLNRSYLFRFVNSARNNFRFSPQREKGRLLLDSLFRKGFSPDVELMSDTTSFTEIRSFYRGILQDMSKHHKVTVVHIPPDYQVDEERRLHIERLFPGKNIHPEMINSLLQEVVSGIPNVSLLDFTEEMKQENQKTPLYIELDGHLNERGQRFLGRAIAAHLAG